MGFIIFALIAVVAIVWAIIKKNEELDKIAKKANGNKESDTVEKNSPLSLESSQADPLSALKEDVAAIRFWISLWSIISIILFIIGIIIVIYIIFIQ